MTDQIKEKMIELRRQGNSYSEVARILNIPVGSVKSYLSRQNAVLVDRCAQCGKALKQTAGHRQKKFCSDKCRLMWWKHNSETVSKRKQVCLCCGRVFIATGSRERKYCCRACYYHSKQKEVAVND